MLKLRLRLTPEIIRFLIVGVSNTGISYLAFVIIMQILSTNNYRGAIAQALSYVCGIFWSFIWNRSWTFKSTNAVGKEFIRFIMIQTILLLFSTLLAHFFIDYLGNNFILSWISITSLITVLNFIALRTWLYPKKYDINSIL
jgi:putative flippase GtrA